MKKSSIISSAFAALLLISSACSAPREGAAPSQQSQESQSLIGSLLSGLIDQNTTVTKERLAGTWKYSTPECRFSSENALAQAGGAVAASTVEEKLAALYSKVGITSSTFSITFNNDNTCSVHLGNRNFSGTYSLDSDTRKLSISAAGGLLKLNAQVYYSYTQLTILFDAQKLLTTAKLLASFTGKGSSTIAAASDILDNYQGAMLGMNLKK